MDQVGEDLAGGQVRQEVRRAEDARGLEPDLQVDLGPAPATTAHTSSGVPATVETRREVCSERWGERTVETLPPSY